MGSRLEILEREVRALYERLDQNRAVWADWLYANHVFVVADNAEMLAKKYGADIDEARAAALLHDCADAVTDRFDPEHEQKTTEIARDLLAKSGYSPEQITTIIDDALRYHGCHGDERPASLVGKILATADGLAHLTTDFYFYAVWQHGKTKTLDDTYIWLRSKIERDYNQKILFDDEREEARPTYDALKGMLAR